MNFTKMFSLQGKNAIVTGGAGILGKSFCEALASFGAGVAVVDIQESAAVSLAAKIARMHKVKAVGVGCDVSDPRSVAGMMKKVSAALGHVHVLHNNAAAKPGDLKLFFGPFEEYSLSQWKETMAVNIDGMFLVAQAVGKQMAAKKIRGTIIQTASIYGMMAPDQRIYEGSKYLGQKINSPAVYAASKGAVISLTRYLAAYWAPKGIRVNTLSPGGVESGQNRAFKKKYSHRVPMGRMARAEEMAGALVYLASDASSYVTGQNIAVDGGLSAW